LWLCDIITHAKNSQNIIEIIYNVFMEHIDGRHTAQVFGEEFDGPKGTGLA
jgi:UDP-glucose 4-epimerase